MDGFININKSAGITSFDVIKKLKRIIPRTKLGHLGTLDPMAQGVLPVAAGFATRLIEYASADNKTYQVEMTLGGVSDTQDAWGNIEYQPAIEFDEADLISTLARYTGKISQIPPMYSAVHHQGERLYELARQGIVVERQAREIEIQSIKLLSFNRDEGGLPRASMEVRCSKGTYIRTLCHDIGKELGTGAYMSALTRTRAGVFGIEEAVTLEAIEQHRDDLGGIVKPVDYPLLHLEKVSIKQSQLDRILNGNRITLEEGLKPGCLRLYDPQGRLVAIAESMTDDHETQLQPIKVFR